MGGSQSTRKLSVDNENAIQVSQEALDRIQAQLNAKVYTFLTLHNLHQCHVLKQYTNLNSNKHILISHILNIYFNQIFLFIKTFTVWSRLYQPTFKILIN